MKPQFKLLLIFVLVAVVFLVFVIFYPLQFDLYEQAKAKKGVDFVFLPLLAFLLIRYIVRKARKGVNPKGFAKEIAFAVCGFAFFYVAMIRSLLSCVVLFVNCAFPEKEIVTIKGTVTEIVNVEKAGKILPQYILTVTRGREAFVFESNKTTVEQFTLNATVALKLKKGILNILYK